MEYINHNQVMAKKPGVVLALVLCVVVGQVFSPAPVIGATSVVSLSPSNGAVGATVALVGTIDTNNGPFEIHWDGAPGTVLGTGTASGTSVSTSFSVPQTPGGTHNVYLRDVTANSYSVASPFLVNPLITINPASGTVGTIITVTGSGFAASETGVVVYYDGTPVQSAISVTSTGTWSTTFTVPESASGANRIIDAYGQLTAATSVADLTFTVMPLISISLSTGTVGTTVTVTARGFTSNESGLTITYDTVVVASGITASTVGSWSGTFAVPESASGVNHIVDAYGALTPATSVADLNFTVTPLISITPNAGTVGTTVAVTARGFTSNESGITITYDSVVVASGITASALGSWSGTFVVPASTAGAHIVNAGGASTPATSVPNVNFNISPQITISPVSGPTGTVVSVTATGFAANEGGIVITLRAITVKDGISADNYGRWNTTFTVPAGPGGKHTVNARGASTAAALVPGVAFSVTARITISPTSGTVGTNVTMTGASFGASETGISITYDGAAVVSGLSANANGDWTASFPVPASVTGSHLVGVSGTFTPATAVAAVSFNVSPDMAITPASGFVGTPIKVSGTGFAANKTITVTYDGASTNVTPSPLTTNAQGSFTASFAAPRSKGGQRKITATDGTASREAGWSMDSTPPPIPKLASPQSGQRISLFGNVPIIFQWSAVTDPSGVYYSLQVATSSNFTTVFLNRESLTTSNYTTSTSEILPLGTYYWRVKAMDGAYNESAWTAASLFKIGWMPLWVFITIVVIVLLLLGGVISLVRGRYY